MGLFLYTNYIPTNLELFRIQFGKWHICSIKMKAFDRLIKEF